MTRPSWLGRAVRNRHRHAIEQASRRWRGGRRGDSARTCRKTLISTQVTHDGAWVWSDGSAPGYPNWNSQYDQPGDDYGPEADAIMNAGDVFVYDGTWFDASNGDYAHALCNNNQADCADDIYLAPYMTGCPEGYDFPATEGACQRAADLSSGYEYGGAEGP